MWCPGSSPARLTGRLDVSLMADRPASGGPAGVLREIQVNLLECKVCFERFASQPKERRPQNLSCGHVLCQECVWALSRPLLRKLECPFCRRRCSVESTSHCQALGDLEEILLTSGATPHRSVPCSGWSSAAVRYRESWGGWGTLMNPTGMAMLGPPGSAVVVHDGEKRVVVLGEDGRTVRSFGRREQSSVGVSYPVGVAVTAGGDIVVTDAGDRAVKVFTCGGAGVVAVAGHFQLPWGVDTTRDGLILVSDVEAGTLSLIKVDYRQAVLLECGPAVSDLHSPRSVACCGGSGSTAVVEHLSAESPPKHGPWRLTVFTRDFHILHQTDSFSLMLHAAVRLHVSAVAFDGDGGLLVVDSDHGMIWSLQKSGSRLLHLTPVVGELLVRPVAVVSRLNGLLVLDGGDHTVKVYSSSARDVEQ
ncbi:E3 ubiquitin-protein ligase NHLRC1-like [Neosynchiropus ocellatus]